MVPMSSNWGGNQPLLRSCSLFPFSLLSSRLYPALRVMFMGPTVARARGGVNGRTQIDAHEGTSALSGPTATWWPYSLFSNQHEIQRSHRAGRIEGSLFSLVPKRNSRSAIGCGSLSVLRFQTTSSLEISSKFSDEKMINGCLRNPNSIQYIRFCNTIRLGFLLI